jgi:hypothetical protein
MRRTAGSLLIILFYCSAIAASPVIFRPGDPAIDGSDYLLSEADFRAVLRIVRDEIAGTHPSFRVRRVYVDSNGKWVTAYAYDRRGSVYPGLEDYFVQLERSKSGWKIFARGPVWVR